MEVKEAIQHAKAFATDILGGEGITNLGLEEVERDETAEVWRVTLGFSRPWNSVRNTLTALTGEAAPRRAYRVFLVTDDGQVVSMKRRTGTED
ncbi:MAG TPA: hypothetical protein VG297_25750 [Bryobacteraceae bacterium]|jgi:hypothetical protein|nr:hypothetical protein [Bryobacteraceae bacterium]